LTLYLHDALPTCRVHPDRRVRARAALPPGHARADPDPPRPRPHHRGADPHAPVGRVLPVPARPVRRVGGGAARREGPRGPVAQGLADRPGGAQRMTDHKNLAEALAAFQAEVPTVAKTKRANVGQYAYTYADLADVVEAATPHL